MQNKRQDIARYIIQFLLGKENEHLAETIGYTADKSRFDQYKLVILPSNFFDEGVFGTKKSLPQLPLEIWKDIPLLFGKAKTEKVKETLIIHADIVASSFFLLSRYEETINRSERDAHGRFPGKTSLPYRAGFLQRPIVDECGVALRQILKSIGLKVVEPTEIFSKIYLTHDADQIAHYRRFRGFAGALSRSIFSPSEAYKATKSYFGGIQHDPWFTFPEAFALKKELQKAKPQADIESIVFIKSGGGDSLFDKPLYDVSNKNFTYLFDLCRENNVNIGLHPSYQAGIDPEWIAKEKQTLDSAIGERSRLTRHHFLASREPEDMEALIEAGFTDDFTLAYADVAGFRLGTSRAVQWIHPARLEITKLTLHPLTLMDSTLHEPHYMNLSIDNAFSFVKSMIDRVKKHNGELVLLWHNTMLVKKNNTYHRMLYEWIINYLKIIA